MPQTLYSDNVGSYNYVTNPKPVSKVYFRNDIYSIEDIVSLTATQAGALAANDIIKLFPTFPGMEIDPVLSWITTNLEGTSIIVDIGTDDVGTSTGADDADALSDGLTIVTTTGLTKRLAEGGTKAADLITRATYTGLTASNTQAWVYAKVVTATSPTAQAGKIRFNFYVKNA